MRWLRDERTGDDREAADALVRAAASSSVDEYPERVMVVERATAVGIWHVGPAALPIPLLSL